MGSQRACNHLEYNVNLDPVVVGFIKPLQAILH